jgi:muramoyltetrapeptide carboxypeptidase
LGEHVRARHGTFAGTDAERVDDLNHFLRDPEIRMIMAVRGGYGCGRLLEAVDFEAARRDPKWVVGYSDLTALQMGLLAKLGLVTVSGPMAGVEFRGTPDPFTDEHFWSLVRGREEGRNLGNPEEEPWIPVRGGCAEGPLIGGCFSLVMSLFGTPYLPALDGAILVLEDIHEHLHRLDRMLVQLRLAGVLDRIAGLVLGQFTDCGPAEPGKPALNLPEIFGEVLAGLKVPCVRGYAYGHEARKRSLPWGVRARLDVDSGTFLLVEEPCAGLSEPGRVE